VRPVGGYNGLGYTSNVGIPNESCYTGTQSSWTEAVFNLPITAGQQFLVRWHFGSDASVQRAGWYIDDVTGIGFAQTFTGVTEEMNSVNQLTTALYSPKPNPAINGIAHISYSLAEPSKVALKIYDASGRNIRTLVNGQAERGKYNLVWDGRDNNHRSVAEGIYFYTLETPKQSSTKKIIFTR
jgi:hypothetical protein